MPNISPAWTITKSGTPYTATPDGSTITYRSINPSEATILIDNTGGTFDTTFSTEDEVTLKIGTTTMMVGYITSIDYEWNPNRQKFIRLRIIDWGSYLAGKTVYENNYKFSIPSRYVFSNAGAQLSGLDNTTGVDTALTTTLKREFYGTYVKDHWYSASETAGAEFFVDENKVLQVWPHGSTSRDLLASNSVRYKIQDSPSLASNQITARLDRMISYSDDATNRFRTVIATNGVYESKPNDPNDFTNSAAQFPYPENGVMWPYNVDPFGVPADWNPKITSIQPVVALASDIVDPATNQSVPVYKLNIKDTSMSAFFAVRSVDQNNTILSWNLPIVDWDYLTFLLKIGLTGGSTTDAIGLYLIDDYPTNSKFYYRNIYPDFIRDSNGDNVADSRSGYIQLEYNLDEVRALTGWTKVGLPVNINAVQFQFSHGGSMTGYNASSFVSLAYCHFYRKRKYQSTGGGTPTTEKIIVDASVGSYENLRSLAVTERNRADVTAQRIECVISGNTDFRKPGYNVDIDFQNIFGTGKTKTRARLDEIVHRLDNGIHYTELLINNPFQRN